uniref:Type VII secretion system protein EssD-like domain-containing protein n=1 Tax=Panagrolaimus davidi TaxID=227884 RepID=A0A914QZ84_9BILA
MSRSFHDPLPNFPDVKVTDKGLVPHVDRDNNGRVIRAYGRIRGNLNVQGTTISNKIRNALKNAKNVGDHCGHIIPKIMGGSGEHLDNIFPQNSSLNSSEGSFEGLRAQWLKEENHFIDFEFFFSYDNDQSKRPSHYLIAIDTFYISNGQVIVQNMQRDGDPNHSSAHTKKWWNGDKYDNFNYQTAAGTGMKTITFFEKSMNSVGKTAKGTGTALAKTKTVILPAAILIDAYRMCSAIKTGNKKTVAKTAGIIAGEWSGGLAGAAAGAAIGSVVPGVGTVIGSLVGGFVGAFSGGWGTKKVADAIIG